MHIGGLLVFDPLPGGGIPSIGRLPPEPSNWMERVVVRHRLPEHQDTRDWRAIAQFGHEIAVDLARDPVVAAAR